MSNLRRLKDIRTRYFITCVTFNRKPILGEFGSLCLDCLQNISRDKSAELIAWVILPDHFHLIVNCENVPVSSYVQSVKQSFSAKYRVQTAYRGRVWQLRFWDHIIRDERDFRRHLDYIHYNPVKHSLVTDPFLYTLSSASLYLESGQYECDWGVVSVPEIEGAFGE